MFKLEKIKSKDVKRVCMAHTVYTLLQYLLISSEEEIKHTYFFLATTLNERICAFFPNKYVLYGVKAPVLMRPFRLLQKLFFMWTRNFRWSFLKQAEIYGLDHAAIFSPLLYKTNFIQLEDGFGTYNPPKETSLSAKLLGFPVEKQWGRSPYCQCRLLTHEPPANSYLREKPYRKIDLQELWQTSTPAKKAFILELFNINQEDLDFLNRYENILLTQCFSEDNMISEEAKIACYRRIIEAYKLVPEKTLIKTHPREKTDYEKIFPGFSVFKKQVPMELISLNTNHIKRAITVSSTSIFMLQNKSTEIIWCDTKFSPELKAKYGNWEIPF